MKTLGLDIGTNSVGSCWVDTDQQTIQFGVSVFPAGVEETDKGRGAPKGKQRREKRGQRRAIARRAMRKARLRRWLTARGWMPTDPEALRHWESSVQMNPWLLRKKALDEELTPLEFGRVLMHLGQRRGAWWSDDLAEEAQENEAQDAEDKMLKELVGQTEQERQRRGLRTFGELMAVLYEERVVANRQGRSGTSHRQAIRNRNKASGETDYEYAADREVILQEFLKIWDRQTQFDGPLARQLTDEVKRELYHPVKTRTWKCQGLLFEQRNTYWNVGTLGRCELEPTDQKCPVWDRYAQEFLVLQDVNNIRITGPDGEKRPLSEEERDRVIAVLNRQKTASGKTVRKALGLDKKDRASFYVLSSDRMTGINTNRFYREVVLGAIGEACWQALDQRTQDSINLALLKLDPQNPRSEARLRRGGADWWGLDNDQVERLIEVWKRYPKTDRRVNYSRKAILNLLPYLRAHTGLSVTEARMMFAEDGGNGASDQQRLRYSLKASLPNKHIRHFMKKHPDLLPPAPASLSNPVVRKAIHEVRRHLIAHIRRAGCRPDRVVVELSRETRMTERDISRLMSRNAAIDKYKKQIIETYHLEQLTDNQREKAIARVRLCRQQKEQCAYSGRTITEAQAAQGRDVEIDHIIPRSRGGHNGLSNKVLCYVSENRGKGNRTPREWLLPEAFEKLEQRFSHLKAQRSPDRNNPDMSDPAKWDNLHKEVQEGQEFLEAFSASQLTDTAYASRQVMDWIRDVLYDGERDGTRRVYATRGRYTALLRHDWGLYLDEQSRQTGRKNRADHRHHALDALLIAMTGPELIQEVVRKQDAWERRHGEGEFHPRRETIDVPWGSPDSFRAEVQRLYDRIIVSHRPEGRKVSGALHIETLYGYIPDRPDQYIKRKYVGQLNRNNLKVPPGWEHLREKLEAAETAAEKRAIRRDMLALKDVPPGKSGIVRDRWLREEIRAALRRRGVDPDHFSDRELRNLLKEGDLVLAGGVPVRKVRVLWTLKGVKRIALKRRNDRTGRKEPVDVRTRPRAWRVYQTQSNHHVEIRETAKGAWKGEVVTTFDAAQRLGRGRRAVDRDDRDGGRYIMSLSIGEMVEMCAPGQDQRSYYRVFKIDGTGAVHFSPHHDAGRSVEIDGVPVREDIAVTVGNLKACQPRKVQVSPLGEVRYLERD